MDPEPGRYTRFHGNRQALDLHVSLGGVLTRMRKGI